MSSRWRARPCLVVQKDPGSGAPVSSSPVAVPARETDGRLGGSLKAEAVYSFTGTSAEQPRFLSLRSGVRISDAGGLKEPSFLL